MKIRGILLFLIITTLVIVTFCPTTIIAASTCTVSISSASFSKSTFNKGEQGTAYITTSSTGSENYSVTYALTYKTTDGVWHSAFKRGSISASRSTTSSVPFSVPTSPSNINCISAVWQIESNPKIQLGSPSIKPVTATVNQTLPVISFSQSNGEVTPGSTKITISATQDGLQSGISRIQSYWIYNGSKYDDSTDYYANIYKQVPSSLTGKIGTVTLYAKAISSGGVYAEKNCSYTLKNNTTPNDTTPPTFTVTPYRGDIRAGNSISIRASDGNGSGIHCIMYAIDGMSNAKFIYSRSYDLIVPELSEGEHTIGVTAKDNAGNYADYKEYTFNVVSNNQDKTPPEIYLDSPDDKVKGKEIAVTASDSGSGLKSASYSWDSERYDKTASYPGNFRIATSDLTLGKHTIYVKVIDNANNIALKNATYNIISDGVTGYQINFIGTPTLSVIPRNVSQNKGGNWSSEAKVKIPKAVTRFQVDMTVEYTFLDNTTYKASTLEYTDKSSGQLISTDTYLFNPNGTPIPAFTKAVTITWQIKSGSGYSISGTNPMIVKQSLPNPQKVPVTLSLPDLLSDRGGSILSVEAGNKYYPAVTVENNEMADFTTQKVNFEVLYSQDSSQNYLSKFKGSMYMGNGKYQAKAKDPIVLDSSFNGGSLKVVYTIAQNANLNITGSPQAKVINVKGGVLPPPVTTDTTKPVVYVDPGTGSITAGSKITVTAKDDNEINLIAYKWDSDSVKTVNSDKVELTAPSTAGSHTLVVYAQDKSSNQSDPKTYAYTITVPITDKTRPVVYVEPGSGSVAVDSKITITAKDESGINLIGYRWDSDPIKKENLEKVELTVPSSAGRHALLVYAQDKSNNQSSWKTYIYTVTNEAITDITAPKITYTNPSNNAANVAVSTTITIKFNEKIKKGTKQVTLNDKDVTTSVSGDTITIRIVLEAGSVYLVKIPKDTVKDLAGNSNEEAAFRFTTYAEVDYQAPEIFLSVTPGELSPGQEITLTAEDKSKISDMGYAWDNKNYTVIRKSSTVIKAPYTQGSHILYVYAKDNSTKKNTKEKQYLFKITSTETGTITSFKDVDSKHWAYEEIMDMATKGIVCGYEDGTFRPNKIVTRAEFAKMMVLSLQLELKNPYKGTFVDVKPNNWAYKYIETARGYLTGYKTNNGLKFRSDLSAQREDVAVALVKAKDYANNSVNVSEISKIFKDSDKISQDLKKYVMIAIDMGLMQGYPDNTFRPKSSLTRAEAAKLLCEIVFGEDEKVLLD